MYIIVVGYVVGYWVIVKTILPPDGDKSTANGSLILLTELREFLKGTNMLT
jgi:hypothetical protein